MEKGYTSKYNFIKEVTKNFKFNNPRIDDVTLRDGEQTPGIVFLRQDKLELAKKLDAIGVEQIEAGAPIVSEEERETIRQISKLGLNASILAWSRAVIKDVEISLDTGCDAIAISIAISDIHLEHKLRKSREEVLQMITECIECAKQRGVYVCFNGEDATRADLGFLKEFVKAGKEAGGDRFRLCDTLGTLTPQSTKYLIEEIKKEVDIEIEMHAHDDYGMAVANTLAAFEAGAEWASTCINGIGERAGNAALEEVIMSLDKLYGVKSYHVGQLKKISDYLERISNFKISPNKSIVGENMFKHESGIHADGVLKFPYTYETFAPEEIGAQRQIVIGKTSGRKAIAHKLEELGIVCNDREMECVTRTLKEITSKRRSSLADSELVEIANACKKVCRINL